MQSITVRTARGSPSSAVSSRSGLSGLNGMCRRKTKRYPSALRLEDTETIGVDPFRRDLGGAEVFPMLQQAREQDRSVGDGDRFRQILDFAQRQIRKRRDHVEIPGRCRWRSGGGGHLISATASRKRGCSALSSHSNTTISVVTTSAPWRSMRRMRGFLVLGLARAERVANDVDLPSSVEQAQHGLLHADMGFTAGDDDLPVGGDGGRGIPVRERHRNASCAPAGRDRPAVRRPSDRGPWRSAR